MAPTDSSAQTTTSSASVPPPIPHHQALMEKIEARTARMAVLGQGYVGLPLALELADAGFPVLGYDPSQEKVDALIGGHSYVEDVSEEWLKRILDTGRFEPTAARDCLRRADCIVVCVPTPLSKTKDPDLSFIESAASHVVEFLEPGKLIIVESTTYPGTTEEMVLARFLETGLKPEEDFFLAFSPERVDPKNPEYAVKNTPKVVGGMGEHSNALVKALYGAFIETIVPVSSPRAAEMVKLLENTFRAVNIGLINEVAIMCEKLGVDVWEVIEAAKTKPFGFMPFYPGPGLGGHCIPIDPMYLGWKLRTLNYRARFIELADHVNSTMPNYVAFRAAAALNHDERSVRGSSILVLGVAYKPGVSDVRESPALTLIDQLAGLGATVEYHDPYVEELHTRSGKRRSVALDEAALARQHLVIVTTAHEEVDYQEVARHAHRILDTRNAMAAITPRENIQRL